MPGIYFLPSDMSALSAPYDGGALTQWHDAHDGGALTQWHDAFAAVGVEGAVREDVPSQWRSG